MSMRAAPLIKEHRLEKLEACLECIDRHPFNRDKQRDCILSIYPGRSEKSVFRGMVIPSCRRLGLILGYSNLIRLSANGKIIVESRTLGRQLHDRVVRAVMYQVDQRQFHFVGVLADKGPVARDSFFLLARSLVGGPSDSQADERTRHWLAILRQVKLVHHGHDDRLVIRPTEYKQTLLDTDAMRMNIARFLEYLFAAYAELTKGRAPLVDIADLREKVALKVLMRDDESFLTEAQFDEILRHVPFSTKRYIISLGRPMGAEEKLFEYNGNHFRTLSIRLLDEREVET